MALTHVVLGIRPPRTVREATAHAVLSQAISRAMCAVMNSVRRVITVICFPSRLVPPHGDDASWEAAPEETAS